MFELPGEHVNEHGGRQSKLYCEYRLLDTAAMHSLTCVLHRGKKYGIDNWRLIPTHEHLNHAMNHIMSYIDYARLRKNEEDQGRPCGRSAEDDLAHAFCRLMFALAKEIEYYGIHPEHNDPDRHEPKTTSTESNAVRRSGSDIGGVHATSGIYKEQWSAATLGNQAGRDNLIGPSSPPSGHSSRN